MHVSRNGRYSPCTQNKGDVLYVHGKSGQEGYLCMHANRMWCRPVNFLQVNMRCMQLAHACDTCKDAWACKTVVCAFICPFTPSIHLSICSLCTVHSSVPSIHLSICSLRTGKQACTHLLGRWWTVVVELSDMTARDLLHLMCTHPVLASSTENMVIHLDRPVSIQRATQMKLTWIRWEAA